MLLCSEITATPLKHRSKGTLQKVQQIVGWGVNPLLEELQIFKCGEGVDHFHGIDDADACMAQVIAKQNL